MNLLNPVWSLRTARCNCCNGQGALCFATCPSCGYVVLVCDEVGTVFPNPKELTKAIYGIFDDPSFLCPSCDKTALPDFKDSTSDEIQQLGFTANDYE
jgi:hypothetical protein